MGGYGLVDTGAGEGAMGRHRPGSRRWRDERKIYMRVDDLDAYLDRAERLGGKRLVPPTDLRGDWPVRHLHRPGRQPGRPVELIRPS